MTLTHVVVGSSPTAVVWEEKKVFIMTNKLRKKLLIIFTILELVCLGVFIYTCVQTLDYTIAVAIDGLSQPWIGSNMDEIATKYNVDLMKFLMKLGDIALIGLLVSVITRFVFCKKKYKIIIGISVGIGLIGCIATMIGGIAAGLIFFVVSFGLFGYSHWLGKEYKDEVVENQESEEIQTDKAM